MILRNYEDLKLKIILPSSPFLNNNNENKINDKLDIVVYQECLIQSQLVGRDENIFITTNNNNDQNNRYFYFIFIS